MLTGSPSTPAVCDVIVIVMWMLPFASAVLVRPPVPLTVTVTVAPGGNPPMSQPTVGPPAVAVGQFTTAGVPDPPDVCANAGAAGAASRNPTAKAINARLIILAFPASHSAWQRHNVRGK